MAAFKLTPDQVGALHELANVDWLTAEQDGEPIGDDVKPRDVELVEQDSLGGLLVRVDGEETYWKVRVNGACAPYGKEG